MEGASTSSTAEPKSTAGELRDAAYGETNKHWLGHDEGRTTARRLGMNDATCDKCREVFLNADKDGSGSISTSELRELLDAVLSSKLSDEDFGTTVAKFDENHDGQLSFDEFLDILADTKIFQDDHLSEMIDIMGDEVRKQMQFERLTPVEKLKIQGVSTKRVRDYVAAELDQMSSCMQLPVAILIFLSFSCAILLHEKIDILHALDRGITWDIDENANFAFGGSIPFENGRMGHKNIQDVNTFADFWSWFSMGLVPLFWKSPTPADWEYSEHRTNVLEQCKSQKTILGDYGFTNSSIEGVSASEHHTFPGSCPEGQEVLNFPYAWYGTPPTPTYKFYYSSIGGLRLRQERTEEMECPGNFGYEKRLHTGPCVPDPGYWLRPEIRMSFFSDVSLMNRPGGETAYLLSGWAQPKVRLKARELENQAWINPYTSKVELLYPLYNGHVGTMSAVYIVFFVNRAGHMYRMIQPVTFWLDPYHGWWNYVVDFVWIFLIAKIALQEGFEVFKLIRIHGACKAVQLYLNISNFIDWMNVFSVVLLVTLWCIHLSLLSKLNGLLLQADATVIGSFKDSGMREEFFVLIDDIVKGGEIRRIAVSLYPIMVVTRFFKAFSAQPRLALVTQTITRASIDLFHFGLVFACIFGLFTLSAIVLFGQDLAEFANVNRAADSVFHILLGDFEWEVMKDVGRLPATIWFWIFILLVNMVMLNMLLAVIMDVYTEVRGSIGSHAETLWSQAHEIFRRWRELKAGRRVSLNHVQDCLDAHHKVNKNGVSIVPTTLNVATFMSLVAGLGEKQAQRILIEALIAQEDELLISQSMAEGMLDIQRIDRRVNNVHVSIQNLVRMAEMSTKLLRDMVAKDTAAKGTPDPATASPDDKALVICDDKLSEQKAEVTLQESFGQKAPPWFESFASSMSQRFDRLEARVDTLSTLLEAQSQAKNRLLALPTNSRDSTGSFAKLTKPEILVSSSTTPGTCDSGLCGVSIAQRRLA